MTAYTNVSEFSFPNLDIFSFQKFSVQERDDKDKNLID